AVGDRGRAVAAAERRLPADAQAALGPAGEDAGFRRGAGAERAEETGPVALGVARAAGGGDVVGGGERWQNVDRPGARPRPVAGERQHAQDGEQNALTRPAARTETHGHRTAPGH